MLGAVVTHAKLTKDGQYLVTVESKSLIIWNLNNRSQTIKEFLPEIVEEVIFFDKEKKFLLVTKETDFQNKYLKVTAIALPQGTILYKIQFPILRVKPICLTYEGAYLIGLAWEKKVFVLSVNSGLTRLTHLVFRVCSTFSTLRAGRCATGSH